MFKEKTLIFDFDGTLADTLETVVQIYNEWAPHYGCLPLQIKNIEALRNEKMQELLKMHRISWLKLLFLIWKIRKELQRRMSSIRPIKNIQSELKKLKEAGYVLGIMSSNSKKNIQTFLRMNKMDKEFKFIYSGRNMFGKAKILRKLIRRENLRKEELVYIGDETRDIEATQQLGIPMIAVTWGLNGREALASLNPNSIIDAPEQISETVRLLK